jgi:hypothetical protein
MTVSNEPSFTRTMPKKNPPKLADCIVFDNSFNRGHFTTKADALLYVNFALPFDLVEHFFEYDTEELELLKPYDIRGLRSYSVTGIGKDKMSGNEFHRIRKELITVSSGRLIFLLEDLYGSEREIELDSSKGLYVPPFVNHTSYSLEDNSGLVIIANTLFDSSNPITFDTFSEKVLRELQTDYKA